MIYKPQRTKDKSFKDPYIKLLPQEEHNENINIYAQDLEEPKIRRHKKRKPENKRPGGRETRN